MLYFVAYILGIKIPEIGLLKEYNDRHRMGKCFRLLLL